MGENSENGLGEIESEETCLSKKCLGDEDSGTRVSGKEKRQGLFEHRPNGEVLEIDEPEAGHLGYCRVEDEDDGHRDEKGPASVSYYGPSYETREVVENRGSEKDAVKLQGHDCLNSPAPQAPEGKGHRCQEENVLPHGKSEKIPKHFCQRRHGRKALVFEHAFVPG